MIVGHSVKACSKSSFTNTFNKFKDIVLSRVTQTRHPYNLQIVFFLVKQILDLNKKFIQHDPNFFKYYGLSLDSYRNRLKQDYKNSKNFNGIKTMCLNDYYIKDKAIDNIMESLYSKKSKYEN